MKLIDREFVSDFFKTYFIFLLLLAMIFFVDTLLGLYQNIASASDNVLGWAVLVYLYSLPHFFVDTAVIAVSTSILWIITKKARSYELLAYLAGGISPVRIVTPILISCAIVSVGTFMISEFVSVPAKRSADWIENIHIKNKSVDKFQQNRHLHLRGSGNRVYLIDGFDRVTNTMTNATIVDLFAETDRPHKVLRAEKITLEMDGDIEVWRFENASVRTFSVSGRLANFDTYASASGRDIGIEIEGNISTIFSNVENVEDMSFFELQDLIVATKSQEKPTRNLIYQLHMKIALPLAILVVGLVVCGHVMASASAGMIFGFGGGLAWIAGYYALFIGCQSISESLEFLPASMIAWLPNTIFLVIGITRLYRRVTKI